MSWDWDPLGWGYHVIVNHMIEALWCLGSHFIDKVDFEPSIQPLLHPPSLKVERKIQFLWPPSPPRKLTPSNPSICWSLCSYFSVNWGMSEGGPGRTKAYTAVILEILRALDASYQELGIFLVLRTRPGKGLLISALQGEPRKYLLPNIARPGD